MANRRSPRLLPQTHASEDGDGLMRRRPASLPDDDDMLWEILLRLPPQPSSLPRASAVSKRWLKIVTDSKFQCQFRAHHGTPPLLGGFVCTGQEMVFTPILDPPDRIPPQRFNLGRYCRRSALRALLDCRHGRVLIINMARREEIVVCDPITREHRTVAIPPDFSFCSLSGAVLCAAGDLGHVHGDCQSSPFKVVLMSICRKETQIIARVYSSETGLWGDLIVTEAPYEIPGKPAVRFDNCKPAVLVGNCLYWLPFRAREDIMEFELNEASLNVIKGPPAAFGFFCSRRQIIKVEDGAVGYAMLSYPRFRTWHRNVNGHGVATWVPWKTIEMDSILELHPQIEGKIRGKILGYEEDTDVIFLNVNGSVYTVQLKSMQSRKLHETRNYRYHPFRSVYTPAIREFDEADMLHNQ